MCLCVRVAEEGSLRRQVFGLCYRYNRITPAKLNESVQNGNETDTADLTATKDTCLEITENLTRHDKIDKDKGFFQMG